MIERIPEDIHKNFKIYEFIWHFHLTNTIYIYIYKIVKYPTILSLKKERYYFFKRLEICKHITLREFQFRISDTINKYLLILAVIMVRQSKKKVRRLFKRPQKKKVIENRY